MSNSNTIFNHLTVLLLGSLVLLQAGARRPILAIASPAQESTAKVEISYDTEKDKSTIRLSPVQISGECGKYISLHMSPSFSVPVRNPPFSPPEIIDFELQTVVRAKLLSTDLYVVFMIDGEKVFLSSNRWAVKRPVPGRVWIGERLVFRMPYETFVKLTEADAVDIKFDAVTFSLGETQKQALREFLSYMKPKK